MPEMLAYSFIARRCTDSECLQSEVLAVKFNCLPEADVWIGLWKLCNLDVWQP